MAPVTPAADVFPGIPFARFASSPEASLIRCTRTDDTPPDFIPTETDSLTHNTDGHEGPSRPQAPTLTVRRMRTTSRIAASCNRSIPDGQACQHRLNVDPVAPVTRWTAASCGVARPTSTRAPNCRSAAWPPPSWRLADHAPLLGVVVASTMKSLLLAEGEPLGPRWSRKTRTEQRSASFGSAIEPAVENTASRRYARVIRTVRRAVLAPSPSSRRAHPGHSERMRVGVDYSPGRCGLSPICGASRITLHIATGGAAVSTTSS